MKKEFPHMSSIKIQGYKPFGDFTAKFGEIEIIVGANGTGKSSLFEFLKFLRNACYQEIPPEIVDGSIGQEIFHNPKEPRLGWGVEVDLHYNNDEPLSYPKELLGPLHYQGELLGPIGQTKVIFEQVKTIVPLRDIYSGNTPHVFLNYQDGRVIIEGKTKREWDSKKPNQLILGTIIDPTLTTLYLLCAYIRGWRFYSSFNINNEKIRGPVSISQQPVLNEDAGNLSAVLFFLMTEHPEVFEELKTHLRSVIPGFRNLTVKARGGPGQVIAFWEEDTIRVDLSLADLSDGILRFICWATLCIMPTPPTLICIDEPDQGVHPRTIPILAGLFEKACERTQILLATHSSYFLAQFDISQIAVMKKVAGESVYIKSGDSQILINNLEDFGRLELELMHKSDELETLTCR